MARSIQAAASVAATLSALKQTLTICPSALRHCSGLATQTSSTAPLGAALLGAGLQGTDVWRQRSLPLQHGSPVSLQGIGRSKPFAAVLLDAAGTLLLPSESVSKVYLRYGAKYGVTLTEQEVLQRFRRAYNAPYMESTIRYVGDARPFWNTIVAQSTGCNDAQLFEEIYEYYEQPQAWKLADGAVPALRAMKAAGIKVAVVSNFDTRLRPILASLGVSQYFDAVVVSAEVGAEKPNPTIFEAALQQLGVTAEAAVHIGDDRRNDLWGARDAGINGWLWGSDVRSFEQVARWAISGRMLDDDDEEWDEDEVQSL